MSFPLPTGRRRRLAARLFLAGAVLGTAALPSAALAEPADVVVGELVQAWPEHALAGESAAEHADEPLSWVETASGDAVRVPTADVAGLPVGATVEVILGSAVQDDAAAEHGLDEARSVLGGAVLRAAPVAAATTTNPVTVVRVVPAGGAPDATPVEALIGAVDDVVAPFWAGQTGGAVRFAVAAALPHWVRSPARCDDPAALWDDAAAAAGFVSGPGRHLLVYVSTADGGPGCPIALGEVGSGPGSGGRVSVSTVLPALIAHELGHNLGLGHSSARQCDGTVETGTCRTAGYRDFYDVMGASWEQLGSLNAAQAARLGALPPQAQESLTVGDAAATVTLAPLAGDSGTRILRLTAPDGSDYWLEHRSAGGQDGWLAGATNRFGLDAGVLLHRSGDLPDTALLLDATPSAAPAWDGDLQAALPLGTPVAVAGGAFTVTVGAVTSTGATVLVEPAPVAVTGPLAAGPAAEAPAVLLGDPATGPAAGPATGPATGSVAGRAADGSAPGPPALAAPSAVDGTVDHGREPRARPAATAGGQPAPQGREATTRWLLPLMTGLGVTGTVLGGWRAVIRLRAACR